MSGKRAAGAPDVGQLRLTFDGHGTRPPEEQVKVRCTACGRRFAVPRWFTEQGLNLRFCTRACRMAWEQERIDGRDRVAPTGRPKQRGGNWQLQARRARQRDGFRCQVCGVTEEALGRQLDVHHRVPARTYRHASESNQLSNLVTVCPACHKRLEERGRLDLPLFEDVRHPGQRAEPGSGA